MQRPDLEEISGFVGVGSVLDGKYRILRILGVGGMGVVVAAEHLKLGENVAIKFLLPRALGVQQRTARFLREARAASRLKSAHVARVYDVDVRADDAPYIVMEYLQGETLQAFVAKGRLPVVEAIDCALEVCEALAEAHALGIVHRDLKPANLFLARGAGNVVTLKVLDFGISKVLEADAGGATTGEAFLGSPPYMSPEQLTNPADVDHRSDIWSLGVILYECLSGAPPFAGASFGEVCALILQTQPVALSERRAELPSALASAVERCLQKDRNKRFGSMLELARAIASFGSARAARALVVVEALVENEHESPAARGAPGSVRPQTLDTGTLTAAADGSRSPSSRKRGDSRRGGALVFGLLVTIGVAVALWDRTQRAERTAHGSGGWEAAHRVAPRALEPRASDPTANPSVLVHSAAAAATPSLVATATAAAPIDRRSGATIGPARAAKGRDSKTVSPLVSASAGARRPSDPVFDERK
jgi:serine/threonine-protein kinase